MTEVHSHLGALVALVIGAGFMGTAIVWAACKSASMADRDMRRTFARMIPPEKQRIEMPSDEIKCRGCGRIVKRNEMTAIGWCNDCTKVLWTGTAWPCTKCGAMVTNEGLHKGLCWECRQADTTGE